MSIRTTIAALTVAAATATLMPVTGASAATQVRVISSCTAAKYKPTSFVFFCADAGAGLQHASYDWWTAKTAHGTATYYYNDCTPYCAAGHVHRQQAEFTLFRVKSTSQYGPLFARAEVDTPQGHHVFDLPTSTM